MSDTSASDSTATVTRLGGFGARVAAGPVSAIEPAAVASLLDEHLVLFFHDPTLDDAGQQALLDNFGASYVHPLAAVAGATEGKVGRIVDDADHPPYQDVWHTDVTWDPAPPTIGSLRAIEMPERGGDTLWSDMYAAYESLSAPVRGFIDGLDAVHDAGRGDAFRSKGGEELFAKAVAAYPGATHPVVGVHPRSGRRYLNVNRGFTRSIAGLSATESDAILQMLFAHAAGPNHQLRHRWTVGDFCIWDERATQHFAAADHFPARREMARYVVR